MSVALDYRAVRQTIKSGDLLAWSHRGWTSWYDVKVQLVRFFTQSEYSHVGVAWVHGGRVWVIESVMPLVRLVPLSNLLPCYHLRVAPKWTPAVEKYALAFVGNEHYRYSQLEAIKAFFGRNDEGNQQLECAEFVRMVYGRAGVKLEAKATPTAVVLAAQEQCGAVMSYLRSPDGGAIE